MRARAAAKKGRSGRAEAGQPARPWREGLVWLTVHVALFGVLGLLLARHRTLMFQGLDGQDMRQWAAQSYEWRSPALEFRSTPLEGAGALEFEQKYRTSIIYGVPFALIGRAPALAVYLLAALLLVGSLTVLGLAMDAPLKGALAGAWAAAFLSLPTNNQTGFYSLISLVPNNAEVHAFVFLAAALAVLALRRQSVMLGAAAGLCVFHVCLIGPMGAALRFVVVGATALPVLAPLAWRSWSPRTFACWALWAAVAAILMPFVAGFYLATPSFLMGRELAAVAEKVGPASVSILFDPRFTLGRKVLLAGMTAALAYVLAGKEPLLRRWTAGVLTFHLLTLALGTAITHGWIHYTGPFLIYLELPLAMFYCLIAGALVQEVLPRRAAASAGLLLLAAYALTHLKGPDSWERERQSLFSRSTTNPIVDRLREEIALHPGASFRGYEASIFGFEASPDGVDWGALHTLQGAMYSSTGNDLRMTGLWKFAIPTLTYENQSENPWLFYAAKHLLARPQDHQVRNIPVHTKINVPFLRSLGVRFVIAASDQGPAGGRRRLTYQALPDRNLGLFELDRPNLGDYSPAEVIRVDRASEAIDRLEYPRFDFRKSAVAFRDDGLPDGLKLSGVSGSTLTWQTDGLHVRATSPGTTLLVLPLIYSGALEVDSPSARAVRVNLCQTGLLFERSVDVVVTQRYGPFRNSWSLLRDAARTRELLKRER